LERALLVCTVTFAVGWTTNWGDVGREHLLEEHWRDYSSDVFNFMRRMGAGADDAADLSQETFVRALRGADRFRGDSTVRTWLFGIARNVFRERVRHSQRHRTVPFTDVADRATGSGSETFWVEIEGLLATLDADDREVLVLRFAFDLSGQETAAALGISHEAVRQRVTRARAAFKKCWEAP
jgi:RNA polymerase sigma-70 factor (ECF subfamily)